MYLKDGVIKKGDVYVIIDNQSDNPISGEFSNMPEGAEVSIDGAVFAISYKGGDGNDVVLIAQNDSVAPTAPNTGAESIAVSPMTAIVAGASAVMALVMIFVRKISRKVSK